MRCDNAKYRATCGCGCARWLSHMLCALPMYGYDNELCPELANTTKKHAGDDPEHNSPQATRSPPIRSARLGHAFPISNIDLGVCVLHRDLHIPATCCSRLSVSGVCAECLAKAQFKYVDGLAWLVFAANTHCICCGN